MTSNAIAIIVAALALGAVVIAQDAKPMSPQGTAATQVGGKWVKPTGRGAPTRNDRTPGETCMRGSSAELVPRRDIRRSYMRPAVVLVRLSEVRCNSRWPGIRNAAPP